MVLYLLSTNGIDIEKYPLTFNEFREICRDSTPQLVGLDRSQWDSGGYDGVNGARVITEQPQPSYNTETQKLVALEPVWDNDAGQWVKGWATPDLSDEEIRISRYDPGNFLFQLFLSSNYATWFSSLPEYYRDNIPTIASRAKSDDNWTNLQAAYDQAKTTAPLTEIFRTEFQGIADTNGVPMTF